MVNVLAQARCHLRSLGALLANIIFLCSTGGKGKASFFSGGGGAATGVGKFQATAAAGGQATA
jgi:hypothetical protein